MVQFVFTVYGCGNVCIIFTFFFQPEEVMKSSCVSLSSHEARLRRRGEKVGRSNKRKENKQSVKAVEEKGGSLREVEGSGNNSGRAAGNTDGKNADTEGAELEDLGDVSQEEPEDCSDGEVGCFNSPDGDTDDIILASPDKISTTVTASCGIQVKEEPPDLNDEMSEKEALDPNVTVKEESETESGDALRQLLALETVANTRQADDGAEVVCIGESTRLTAHVGEAQRGAATLSNQVLYLIMCVFEIIFVYRKVFYFVRGELYVKSVVTLKPDTVLIEYLSYITHGMFSSMYM